MKSNKKILCLLIALIMLLAVNAVSATEDTSDIIAADDSAIDSEISLSQDNELGAGETFVITNTTFSNYFTADGELNGNVSEGSTLDFQGTFTGTDYKVNITKPVTIISSTEDALFNDIGKKDTAGGCFHISAGGSGTTVTGLNFINSAFYVTGASDVVIEDIYMMANMSGVGSGTGFMCVQAGSKNVTVKDSYFENRGTGSSIIVIGYSDYCTVDNNEVVINGSSGNAVYMTTYVPAKWSGNDPTGNVISNNYIHGLKSGFCMALVVAGSGNLIENNTVDYNGASGIAGQSFSTQYNNNYTNNVLTGGCSFTAGENSYVSGNIVDGSMTAGSNSVVEDNEMKSLSLSKANAVVDNNIIGEGGVTLNAAALNTTLTNNIILSPVTVKSKNNTIQNNTISAESEYAIDLTTTTGNEVSFNTLSSNDYMGDEAVKSNGNNSVHDNAALGNVVTKDNFFVFFDTDGNYRDLNFTVLYFKGEFDNLVDAITINKNITVLSLNATLNNMAFILLADSINLNGLKMNFDAAPVSTMGSAILINGTNATIEDMLISYVLNESDTAYIIYAENADDLCILGNEFYLNAKTDGSDVNNVIYVSDTSGILLEDNIILADIPSCYVDWKEVPPASGNWVKFPVSEGLVFEGCSDLTIADNFIGVSYNDVVGSYDTIYVVDIKNSSDVEFSDNNVSGIGKTYIYGLYVEADGLLIDNNIFTIKSDYYANDMEIEASLDATVSNNILTAEAESLAYPIYSGMNGGDLEVAYINNTINAKADIVYGMELCGSNEIVMGNTINVLGNKTTGIASKSKSLYVFNNTINAPGENLGNSSVVEIFKSMSVGIQLVNSFARIEANTINSDSIGIHAEGGSVLIYNNAINVTDNGLTDSYAIFAEESDVNILDNNVTYVGNTSGETINNAVCLNDCAELLIEGNVFDISIPSCYVDWKEIPPGSGVWVKFPVSEGLVFNNCSALNFTDNTVDVEANSAIGSFDTIYAIDIKDSDNVSVCDNAIGASGFSYVYGLYIEADDSIVDSNTFIIKSSNYANGIEIEASLNATVSNNSIIVASPVVAYPVYSGMNGGDLEVKYINNTIGAVSDIVYGMELCGTYEVVRSNVIVVEGNKTTGLAIKSKESEIRDNDISALGENLGNSSTVETFIPMTAAIQLVDSDAFVTLNSINSLSRGIYIEGGVVSFLDNEINVTDNGMDDSCAIAAKESDILISYNNITYVGNTSGSTDNYAIYLEDCINPVLTKNNIDITIPSCAVDWREEPAGSGNWVGYVISEGIHIDSPETIFNRNEVTLDYSDVVGAYDTIYVIHIISDKAKIASNNIEADGHTYIYGLQITGENLTVEKNNITANSDAYYANGINIEGPASGVVKDNFIANSAPGVVYPIYSAMSNGNVSVDYVNNVIVASADLAYGMEIAGLEENVEGNKFLIAGNESIGIYSKTKNLTVKDNEMKIFSNSTKSTAFKGISGNATVSDNNISVMGEYSIDVTKINAVVKDNYLVANELTGDASVDYDMDTSSVYNNTPAMEKYFLTSDGLVKYFGNADQLKFTLTDASGTPMSNKTIIITINGRNYTRTTDENGTAKMNIGLNSGDYTATGTYLGETYNLTADAPITILPTVEADDITKIYKNDTQFYATFCDSDGKTLANNTEVEFNINGVFYKRYTNENGTARLNINLNPGVYVITSYNPKTGEQAANNITVLSSIVNNTDLVKYYRNASQYVVTILDGQGNPAKAGENVTFNINGVFYTRQTNESGQAKLSINLEPGEYIITAQYNGLMASNNITVLSVIETENLTMKYKDGSKFNATILDGQGKPLANANVTFNINGVFYNKVTDENGVAHLNINLMAGEYIITTSYNGMNAANKITISS